MNLANAKPELESSSVRNSTKAMLPLARMARGL
jgi:hypothetical protein